MIVGCGSRRGGSCLELPDSVWSCLFCPRWPFTALVAALGLIDKGLMAWFMVSMDMSGGVHWQCVGRRFGILGNI